MVINWEQKSEKMPIRKSHPFKIEKTEENNAPDAAGNTPDENTSLLVFSNPKRRKVEELKNSRPAPVVKVPKSANRQKKISKVESLIQINYLLSAYVSLALNSFLIFTFIVLVFKFVNSIRKDIVTKNLNLIEINKIKVEECRRQYVLNKCDPKERVPALESQCKEWEECMKQNPFREEITKAGFRVLSDSIEELLSGFSIRTVLLLILVTYVLLRLVLPPKIHK